MKKINIPKKGAGRRLAKKLEDLANQPPSKELIEKLGDKQALSSYSQYPFSRDNCQCEICFK